MKKIENLFKKSFAQGLKPPENMTVSQWANKYFKLPSTSAEPGQYKTARTPYVTEIMDAFTQADVHKVVVKSSAQIGKSSILLAVVGRFAMLDPCNIMIIQPTLELAQDFSKDRLERMIQDTPVLTPLFYDLGKTRNPNQTILSKFFTGGRIVLQGANSPAGLASRPIRLLLCDETDRFPTSAGEEGDPISLAEKRQTSYWNYKTGLFSTPTVEGESRIDAEYNLGTREEWQHACPNCGEYHFLSYKNMVTDFDEHLDEHNNRNVTVNSVKWRCPECGMEFTEIEMKNTYQRYVTKNYQALKNNIRSFWINGFASPWVSWRTLMQEYETAKGNPAREAVVFNTRFGVSYKVTGEFKDETMFLNRREAYDAEIPAGVLLLTAAVDVQNNRLEYEVVGWGVEEECWGIKKGVIRGAPNNNTTWQKLDEVLDKDYKLANGTNLKIVRTFIDSGYSTSNVYDYCRANFHKGRFAIKGTGVIGASIINKYSYPKNSGVMLTIIGVNNGKQELFSRLAIQKAGAMYMHFPLEDELERGYDQSYFKQLTAERRVVVRAGGLIQSRFEPVSAKERNEACDIRVYNLACLKSLEITDWTKFQVQTVKPAVKKASVVSKAVDIW